MSNIFNNIFKEKTIITFIGDFCSVSKPLYSFKTSIPEIGLYRTEIQKTGDEAYHCSDILENIDEEGIAEVTGSLIVYEEPDSLNQYYDYYEVIEKISNIVSWYDNTNRIQVHPACKATSFYILNEQKKQILLGRCEVY